MHRTGAIGASGAVLVIAASFLGYAVSMTATGEGAGVPLLATFTSSDGLAPGSAVELAGLPVGRVRTVELDRSTFLADVTMDVGRDVRIPVDSTLTIESGGASSDGVVQIVPGHAREAVGPGGRITATQAATNLEQDIGNYIFGDGGLGGSGSSP